MKDFEKAALGIGAAALGIAAYQAYKTKQGVDATDATDPSRNPVSAAIDRSQYLIGTTYDWFRSKFDTKTGYVKGKVDDLLNVMKADPVSPFYWVEKGTDFGRDATEAGTKYLWSVGATINKAGKEKIAQLTNKDFTLMGSLPTMFKPVTDMPRNMTYLGNVISGIGEVKDTVKTKAEVMKDKIYSILSWRE